ncbi:hypothetical protein C7M84_013404 [Penaeus vannamei]|uniref:RNA-directed DNA polymerase n=1 Tax=Penaeus vannamei TaxID=6689 RepID=A0A423SW61_PENVA|nr:hypothetical protein C7M84_013404 [Penaeus vannamei]
MGMDFLRRLDMKLFTGNKSSKAYLLLGFAEQVGAEQLVDVSAEGNVTGKEPRVKEDTVTHPSSTGHAGRDFSPEAAEFSQPKFTDATTQVHSLAEIDADELAPRSCKVWPADEQVAECPSDTSDDDIELYSLPCSQDEALAVNENHSVNSDTPVNLATLASAVLREYQLKEDLWKEIIEFLEGKKLPRRALPASLHEFELDDGVLYHLKSLPDRIIRQVCVPHSLQSQALHLAHDHPTAAHPGALRTYHNLQNSYFFPNMFRLCKWYVQHCTACQHRKGSRERAEMQCRPPPSGPLELVSADLMDLRASVGGYRYVLSIVDHHSRVVKDALAMLVADKPGRWPLYLTSVRLAINSAIHRSVGDQPLYLLTGKMALFPRGLTNQVTTDTNLRVQQLAKARQLAIAASLRSREANAQAHNRKVRSTWQPEEGALVLRRDFTGGALQDRWQGPCRVIKQIGPVVFEVKDLQPPYRIVKQHRDQLKMYLPPAELDYVEVGDRLPSDPPGVDGPLPGRPPDVAAPVHVLDDFGYDRTEDEFSNSGPLNRSPSVYHFLYSGADMSTETNNDYSDYEVWEE